VPFTEDEFRATKENVLADKLAEEALETFKRRMDTLQKVAYPVIKIVYEERGAMYENILVPITDGKRA
jgi:preprotein translocase subunit SecA